MYKWPKDDGNGPMKSIPQTSKSSTTKMLFNGISFLRLMFPIFWHLSQLEQKSKASLNKVGQKKPDCKTLRDVFLAPKCPPHANVWLNVRMLCCSLSGTHLLMIWSGQYLNKYGYPKRSALPWQGTSFFPEKKFHFSLHHKQDN
ncbi:hypothetical protein B879_04227 [Cecembia lonarensis LW9]|uniref:Uncharacterized protein n=1 Tax=Cecembia lonarensis (strain CCUG 58316 / KCTC 22772 / LW9) TaxID=1225176 RepID=K1LSV1_CECL9|nr:hypothetical protein B879_04227 [Cecembia lonarensis LW9]